MRNNITSVTYSSGGTSPNFAVDWGGYNGQSILQVNTGSGIAPGSNSNMPSYSGSNQWNNSTLTGNWTASSPLQDNVAYTMQVLPEWGGDYDSNLVPILYYPLTNIVASFDGTDLAVSWTPPKGANQPTQTKIHLNNTTGDQYFTTNNSNNCSFAVNSGLTSGDNWTVDLQPQWDSGAGVVDNPLALGPWSGMQSVTLGSNVILSVAYNQGDAQPEFTVDWSQNASYQSALHVIDDQGNPVNGTTTMPDNWNNFASLTGTWTASAPLTEGVPYNMQVVQDGDGGAVSNSVPILYYPVTNIGASFDGTALAVSWTPPEGANQPTQTKIHLNNTAGRPVFHHQ